MTRLLQSMKLSRTAMGWVMAVVSVAACVATWCWLLNEQNGLRSWTQEHFEWRRADTLRTAYLGQCFAQTGYCPPWFRHGPRRTATR